MWWKTIQFIKQFSIFIYLQNNECWRLKRFKLLNMYLQKRAFCRYFVIRKKCSFFISIYVYKQWNSITFPLSRTCPPQKIYHYRHCFVESNNANCPIVLSQTLPHSFISASSAKRFRWMNYLISMLSTPIPLFPKTLAVPWRNWLYIRWNYPLAEYLQTIQK